MCRNEILSSQFSDCMIRVTETINTDGIQWKTQTFTHCCIFIWKATKHTYQSHHLCIVLRRESNNSLFPLSLLFICEQRLWENSSLLRDICWPSANSWRGSSVTTFSHTDYTQHSLLYSSNPKAAVERYVAKAEKI